MRKYETLKVIVILQAVSMIALAGFTIWSLWPSSESNEADHHSSLMQDSSKANAADEVVAVIADQKITRQQLIEELMKLYGDRILEQMLEHYAIQIASKEYQITVTDNELEEAVRERAAGYESVEQYLQVMKDQLGLSQAQIYTQVTDELLLEKIAIKDIEVSEQEIKQYIHEHEEIFKARSRLGLSWIVVETIDKANQLMQLIGKGDSFSELAVKHSTDSFTASNGGKLGMIEQDDPFYSQSMLELASSLQVGDVAGPIEVDEGLAIIYLTDRQTEKAMDKHEIERYAHKQVALLKAEPLNDVLNKLLSQYKSGIKK